MGASGVTLCGMAFKEHRQEKKKKKKPQKTKAEKHAERLAKKNNPR
jgi:hypothetical protein